MESGYRQMGLKRAGAWLETAARALFPHHCAGCGREGEAFCQDCQAAMPVPGKGIFSCPVAGCGAVMAGGGGSVSGSGGTGVWMEGDSAAVYALPVPACHPDCSETAGLSALISAEDYDGSPLGGLLRLWKYGGVDEAGQALYRRFAAFGAAFAATAPGSLVGYVVAPVPLHPFKQAARGFNQAEELAKAFASGAGLRSVPNLLRRGFGGSSQAALSDRAARLSNVAGLFRPRYRLPGARIILVDDVATTGATLRECAQALRRAGALQVLAVTLLRRK